MDIYFTSLLIVTKRSKQTTEKPTKQRTETIWSKKLKKNNQKNCNTFQGLVTI